MNLIKKVVFMVLTLLVAGFASAESVVIDGVAARVNDDVITVSDVLMLIGPAQRRLSMKFKGDDLKNELEKVYVEALDMLIENQLILDFYEGQKMQIPDWIIDERVEEIIQKSFGGDRAELISSLTKENLSYDQWRDEIRNRIIISYMKKIKVDDTVMISATDVKKAYKESADQYKEPEKIKLRIINLRKDSSESSGVEKRDDADEIKKLLDAGKDFAAIAVSRSEGGKAKDGGDWGWVEPRILRPELAKAASSLKPGEVSSVIETKEDFYILKVEGRKSEAIASFDDVHARIASELRQKKIELVYSAWIKRLKETAHIDILKVKLF